MDFYSFCEGFATNFINVCDSVYQTLSKPLSEFLGEVLPEWIVNLIPSDILGYTLISVMFGVGLPLFMVIVIIKFFTR